MAALEPTCCRATTARAGLFGVRLHGFDAAVERAMRDWESERGARRAMTLHRSGPYQRRDEVEEHRHRRAARGGVATVMDPDRLGSG